MSVPRPLRFLILALTAALLLSACTKSEVQQAGDALQAGITAYNAKDYTTAVKEWQECLKHDSLEDNKKCYYNIGLVYQNNNQLALAENEYRLALSLDPNYGPALFNLAIARVALGDNTEAISLYRTYVSVLPNDPNGHLNLGLLLRQTGDVSGGNAELAIALQLNPQLIIPSPAPTATPQPTPTPSNTPEPTPVAS